MTVFFWKGSLGGVGRKREGGSVLGGLSSRWWRSEGEEKKQVDQGKKQHARSSRRFCLSCFSLCTSSPLLTSFLVQLPKHLPDDLPDRLQGLQIVLGLVVVLAEAADSVTEGASAGIGLGVEHQDAAVLGDGGGALVGRGRRCGGDGGIGHLELSSRKDVEREEKEGMARKKKRMAIDRFARTESGRRRNGLPVACSLSFSLSSCSCLLASRGRSGRPEGSEECWCREKREQRVPSFSVFDEE